MAVRLAEVDAVLPVGLDGRVATVDLDIPDDVCDFLVAVDVLSILSFKI